MQTILNFAIPAAIGVVFVILCIGIYSLMRGGEFARSNSNKLMRARVVAQFVAILVLLAALWWSTRGGA